MNLPIISVITPVYNAEKYIHRCVNSILNQTFSNFELILIDDGSSDHCGSICDEYSNLDNRIKVFHIKNGGAANARNIGLNIAKGKYIMFADSDDIVAESWCSNLFNCINMYPTTLSFCSFLTTDLINANYNQSDEYSFVSFSDILSLHTSGFGFLWNKIFIREIIENNNLRFRVQPKKRDYNEDLLFIMSYIQHCSGFSHVNSYDYIYSVRQDSLSKNCNLELQVEKYLEKFKLWQEYVNTYCQGDNRLLSNIANEALFQIILFLKNETKTSLLPTRNFKKLVQSDILSNILDKLSESRENKTIISLLKSQNIPVLWIILKKSN